MAASGLVITSPTGQGAQTGNWHTAARYQRLLHTAGISSAIWVLDRDDDPARSWAQQSWTDVEGRPVQPCAALVLHAGRGSAVATWLHHAKAMPLGVVVTGTDLYRDLQAPGPAMDACLRSLELAQRIVCLQARAAEELGERFPNWMPRLRVIPQTVEPVAEAARAKAWSPAGPALRLLVSGHIRPEKDPLTALDGVLRAADRHPEVSMQLAHVGGALDANLSAQLHERAQAHPERIRMLGRVSQAQSRGLMAAAHLLIQPSRMEGGALVVSEACAVGLPVLASRVAGHQGLLGDDYPGFFKAGSPDDLARVLHRWIVEPEFRAAVMQALQRAAPALTSPRLEAAQISAVAQHLLSLASQSPSRDHSARPAPKGDQC